MSEEKSAVDRLLDENDAENIFLYDENNKKIEFEQVAMIPMDEKIYALLKPVDTDEEDDVAYVFVIEEIDGEDCLVMITNQDEIDRVFDEYYELLEEEGISVDQE